MSATGKPAGKTRLEQIEEGLVENVLGASEQSLREELVASGDDPSAVIAEIDLVITSSRARASRARLEQAKSEVRAWQGAKAGVSESDREKAKSRLAGLRAGTAQGQFMLAARKGKGLSESDEKGVIEDMAELERLEGNDEAG